MYNKCKSVQNSGSTNILFKYLCMTTVLVLYSNLNSTRTRKQHSYSYK